MLTRIISGVVGIIILSVVLFFHNTIVLPIGVAAIIAVMLFELLRAVKMEKCIPVLAASELCGIAMPFLYELYYKGLCYKGYVAGGDPAYLDAIFLRIAIFAVTLVMTIAVFITWLKKHKEIRYEQVFFVLAAMILVPQAMCTMIRIDREYNLFMLVIGLCGAWIADTGAYFTGVAIGKHKLCPEISPKKTIEGFIGGIITTGVAYAAAFCVNKGFEPSTLVIAFIIGVLCAVVGTIGDLSASMVKRQIGFKDYGRIMPGHGGLMDRFDSILFVVPTFYALLVIGRMLGFGIL